MTARLTLDGYCARYMGSVHVKRTERILILLKAKLLSSSQLRVLLHFFVSYWQEQTAEASSKTFISY